MTLNPMIVIDNRVYLTRRHRGKNARGRPRKMYLDQLMDWLNLNTAGTLQLPHGSYGRFMAETRYKNICL